MTGEIDPPVSANTSQTRGNEMLFNRSSRKRQRVTFNSTAMESLEQRRLLSAVNLTADDVTASQQSTDGEQQQARFEFTVRFTTPDGSQELTQVEVGQQFRIEVSGHDLRDNAQGIFSAFADVLYDDDRIEVANGSDAITYLRASTITSGSVDDANGLVDEAGSLLFATGGPASTPLFAIDAVAVAEGIATVTTDAPEVSINQIALFGLNGVDLRHEATYGGATLQIGELNPVVTNITVDQSPSINDDGEQEQIVVRVNGQYLTQEALDAVEESVVRQEDGSELELGQPIVETIEEGSEYRLTYTLTTPDGGWDHTDNGTYDVIARNIPGNVVAEGTIASFDINLTPPPPVEFQTHISFTDANGNVLDHIEVGQEFRIVISGQDTRDLDQQQLLGLLSAVYDVNYDTAPIDVLDVIHHYPFFQEGGFADGVIDDAAGLVDGTGGFFGAGAPGSGDPLKVVELVAVARSFGTLNVTATPDDSPQASFAVLSPGLRTATDVRDLVQDGTGSIEIVAPLEVTIDAESISENGGHTTVTVSRGNILLDQSVAVQLVSSDDSELQVGSDLIVIQAGQSSVTVNLDAVDDRLLDGTQTVTLTAFGTGFSNGSDTIDVTDYETLTVDIDPEQVSEDNGAFAVTVFRSDLDDLTQAVTLHVSTSDDSQVTLDETVTFEAGEESVEIQGTANGNDIEDGDRVVTVTVTADGFVNDFEGNSDDLLIVDVEHSDVVVTRLDAIGDRIDGGTTVRVSLLNQGSGTARDFDIAIVHSDNQTIGDSDDQTRLTHRISQLAAGESVTLELDVDFDLRTVIERFMDENGGNPGELAVSTYVDYVAATVDPEDVLDERNADGDAEDNNSGRGLYIDIDDVTALPFDFDGDNVIAPLDALAAISEIGTFSFLADSPYDVDFDGFVSPLDAATVVGHIGLTLNESVFDDPQVSVTPPTTGGGTQQPGTPNRVSEVIGGQIPNGGGANSRVGDLANSGSISQGSGSGSSTGAPSRVTSIQNEQAAATANRVTRSTTSTGAPSRVTTTRSSQATTSANRIIRSTSSTGAPSRVTTAQSSQPTTSSNQILRSTSTGSTASSPVTSSLSRVSVDTPSIGTGTSSSFQTTDDVFANDLTNLLELSRG